jgi:hypothetical protein
MPRERWEQWSAPWSRPGRRTVLLAGVVLWSMGAAPSAMAASKPPLPGITVPALGHSVRSSGALPGAGGTPLSGIFAVKAGSCSGGTVSGSTFRMVTPTGNAQSGPWVGNADSPCSDNTYSPLAPGTDGGLSTTGYQPEPNPPFDSGGNGKASAITQPTKFFGVNFALSTNAKDPQTGANTTVPSIVNNAGTLSGDLRALGVAWNNQQFNQGSPKPDGSHPGLTAGPTGTYDPSSGAFTLDWTSTIVGGPFNNFTGKWHFEGTFKSASASSTTPGSASSGATASGTPAGSSAASPSSSASSSSGTQASSTASSGSVANTGPTFPAWPGAVLFALGMGGLLLRRRVGVPAPRGAP